MEGAADVVEEEAGLSLDLDVSLDFVASLDSAAGLDSPVDSDEDSELLEA